VKLTVASERFLWSCFFNVPAYTVVICSPSFNCWHISVGSCFRRWTIWIM